MYLVWSSELILLFIWGIVVVFGDFIWELFVDKGGVMIFIIISVLMVGFGFWVYKCE